MIGDRLPTLGYGLQHPCPPAGVVVVDALRLMEVGPPPLVDVTWVLVQTLPVNKLIHEELESMDGRWVRLQ